ncbi:transposase domain-containing protein [Pseudorhodobacter sp.]
MALLIETYKINGIGPSAFLNATLTLIANGHTQSSIYDLRTWNFKPSR